MRWFWDRGTVFFLIETTPRFGWCRMCNNISRIHGVVIRAGTASSSMMRRWRINGSGRVRRWVHGIRWGREFIILAPTLPRPESVRLICRRARTRMR